MIGLYLKFGGPRMIKSGLNKALFRVHEVQEGKNMDFKAHLVSRARAIQGLSNKKF